MKSPVTLESGLGLRVGDTIVVSVCCGFQRGGWVSTPRVGEDVNPVVVPLSTITYATSAAPVYSLFETCPQFRDGYIENSKYTEVTTDVCVSQFRQPW